MASHSTKARMDLPSAAKNIESTSCSFNQQHQADGGFEKEDFPASDRFCSTMERMISQEDIRMLLEKQKEAITKFEKTNETFSRFNALSAARFGVLSHQFANHTGMLLEMKKDLDSIFRRIRALKTKLMKQYGQAFYATAASIQKLEEELGASIESEDSSSKRTQTASKETEIRDETNSTNVAGKAIEQAISQVETDVGENKEKANSENITSDSSSFIQNNTNPTQDQTNTLDTGEDTKDKLTDGDASCYKSNTHGTTQVEEEIVARLPPEGNLSSHLEEDKEKNTDS